MSSPAATIILASQDGAYFAISKEQALESKLLAEVIDMFPLTFRVPLLLNASALRDVVAFLNLYYDNAKSLAIPARPIASRDIVIGSDWCDKWVRSLDGRALMDVASAAFYLGMPKLLKVSTARVATKIKGAPLQDIGRLLSE